MCWYLAYHIKSRVVFVRDILHREWNDCTLALRQAGLWWVVLLTTVVFNFPFGPWNGAAWWQKLLEGSNEYLSLEQWGNPLFKTMYPYICRDRGEAPVGTPEHMQLILRETVDSEAFRKKGEKTALRRWFSWMGASHFHDRVWHARLCVLYSIAMRLGLYRGFEETPWWGGPNLVAPLRAPDSDEPAASTADKAAATTLAQTAKAAAASDAPAKELKSPVNLEPTDAQVVRNSCKNTLLASCAILSRDGLQQLVRMIMVFCGPFYDQHSEHARSVRTPEETAIFLHSGCSGQMDGNHNGRVRASLPVQPIGIYRVHDGLVSLGQGGYLASPLGRC